MGIVSRGTRPLEATLGSYSIVNGEYKQKKSQAIVSTGQAFVQRLQSVSVMDCW